MTTKRTCTCNLCRATVWETSWDTDDARAKGVGIRWCGAVVSGEKQHLCNECLRAIQNADKPDA